MLRLGISYLTLYAFSVENWKRPHTEIKLLMSLLREYLKKEFADLNRQNIRLEVIGRIDELPAPVVEDLRKPWKKPGATPGCAWSWRLNYGARAELVDAVQELIDKAEAMARSKSMSHC